MGVIIGVCIGYALGSRAGEQERLDLRESWTTIRDSEEVRAMLAGGLSIAGSAVQKATQLLASRLQQPGSAALRRVA